MVGGRLYVSGCCEKKQLSGHAVVMNTIVIKGLPMVERFDL